MESSSSLLHVMSDPDFQVPELKRLLALEPGYKADEVEMALRPFLESWRLNPRFSTHLLGLLAKRRLARLAEDVLWCMQKERLEVSVFECSSVISAYDKDGNWKLALRFLRAMHAFCSPNIACSWAAKVFSWGVLWRYECPRI